MEALQCLEQGTQKLEEGDVQAAKVYPVNPAAVSIFDVTSAQDLYKRSVEIKRTASALFNLGVTHYHLSTCPLAVVHPLANISRCCRGV